MTHSNVDENEIAKFERLASRWWDPNGEFKPLHKLNPVRANYIDEYAKVAEKKLIDIGCGGGILSEAMAHRGAMVTGIDMGEAPLEVARLHALESQVEIDYKRTTAEEYAEAQSENFDVICCLEMLEHVPNPEHTVKACAELAKPGAYLFFSTINRNPKSYGMAILGAEYILRWLPKGTHEYKKFIRPSELAHWIREAGLSLIDASGLTYNIFTQQFQISSNDVDVNYIVCAKKPS